MLKEGLKKNWLPNDLTTMAEDIATCGRVKGRAKCTSLLKEQNVKRCTVSWVERGYRGKSGQLHISKPCW